MSLYFNFLKGKESHTGKFHMEENLKAVLLLRNRTSMHDMEEGKKSKP